MSFQIVYPIPMAISADSFKDAVKQYVKLNYDVNIASLILTDQYRYMKANLKYYKDGPKDKVGISLFPTTWSADSSGALKPNMWPYSPQITYDTKEYPRTTFIETPAIVVPKIVSVNPLGSVFSPVGSTPLVAGVTPFSPVFPF